jgi:hypothetical protein
MGDKAADSTPAGGIDAAFLAQHGFLK